MSPHHHQRHQGLEHRGHRDHLDHHVAYQPRHARRGRARDHPVGRPTSATLANHEPTTPPRRHHYAASTRSSRPSFCGRVPPPAPACRSTSASTSCPQATTASAMTSSPSDRSALRAGAHTCPMAGAYSSGCLARRGSFGQRGGPVRPLIVPAGSATWSKELAGFAAAEVRGGHRDRRSERLSPDPLEATAPR